MAQESLERIGKGIANILGFSTAVNDIRSLFGGSSSGKSGLSDYIARNKAFFNGQDLANVDPAVNSASSNALKLNEDGSFDMSGINATNLSDLIPFAAEWIAGANPQLTRMWNTAEAQKERDWQTEMSNTAYQRSVADMKAAGINPIMAYAQGGATSGSGAVASGSPSSASGVGSLISSIGSVIKTVLSEDRLSDRDTVRAANEAMKLKDNHSAIQARNDYLKYKQRFEFYDKDRAASEAAKNYAQANWYKGQEKKRH